MMRNLRFQKQSVRNPYVTQIKLLCMVAVCVLSVFVGTAQNVQNASATKNAQSNAENITIKGVVREKNGTPIVGATIMVVGSTKGTSTNDKGAFQVTLKKGGSILVSFIGFKNQSLKLNTSNDKLIVVLEADMVDIEQVVVTGFGKLKKESFTGNATVVTRKDLLMTNNKSAIAALQFFDPSFRIKENSIFGSDPNSLPEFNIRGESSLPTGNSLDAELSKRSQRTDLKDNPNLPVFILDGFEVSVQKIYDMDINRIESMTILKDAAATAMYGSRAANGVVVVTTVAPKAGELTVNYNFTAGMEFPDLSDYNLANAVEKLQIEKDAGLFIGGDGQQVPLMMKYNDRLNQIKRGVKTDWLAIPLRNVFNHTHSVNVYGGVKEIRYSVDGFYDSNQGAMKGSFRQRAGAGLKLDYNYKNWLQLSNNITFDNTKSENSPYGDFSDYVKLQPYFPLYAVGGGYEKTYKGSGSDERVIQNPLWAVMNLESYSGRSHINDLTESLGLNIIFFDGLVLRNQFSISKSDSESKTYQDPRHAEFAESPIDKKGRLKISSTSIVKWNLRSVLNYNKQLSKNFINASFALDVQENRRKNSDYTYLGFQISNLSSESYAATRPEYSITSSHSRLIGLLGLVNYSYDNIYLADFSLRMDGSSDFQKNKRFIPFWSVGAGINVHNYEFFKQVEYLSQLKVRASYGNVGKVDVPASASQTTYMVDKNGWYYTGPGAYMNNMLNENLTWQSAYKLDAGIMIGFLKDRFTFEGSFYDERTDGSISTSSLRYSSGFDSWTINGGATRNYGFEGKLYARVYRDKNWLVSVSANIAANKNKITKLSKEEIAKNNAVMENFNKLQNEEYKKLNGLPIPQLRVGNPISAIYAVESLGIDPSNGKELFRKPDGSTTYIYNGFDQIMVGKTAPDANGTFSVNVAWRGFYLNTSFQYQWGAQSDNSTVREKVELADISNSNVDKRLLTQRWKKPGDLAQFLDLGVNAESKPSSRFIQDNNYLNFASISCGYDFKSEDLKKFKMQSLGLRFNMNEVARWSTILVERGTSYPYAKNYSFTLSIGF